MGQSTKKVPTTGQYSSLNNYVQTYKKDDAEENALCLEKCLDNLKVLLQLHIS